MGFNMVFNYNTRAQEDQDMQTIYKVLSSTQQSLTKKKKQRTFTTKNRGSFQTTPFSNTPNIANRPGTKERWRLQTHTPSILPRSGLD